MKYSLRPSVSLTTKLTTRTWVLATVGLLAFSVSLVLISNFGVHQPAVAAVGFHGNKTITGSNVILNEYTTLTSSASSGSTSLTVANAYLNQNNRFASNLAAGELILIIQMQGATLDETDGSTYGAVASYGNAGKREFVEVASVPNSTTISLVNALSKSYSASGKVQIVRIPRYEIFTIQSGASVTCPAWDGATGGIVSIEANKTTTINGSINVSGKGFRGGTVEQKTSTPGNHTTYRSSNDIDGAEKGEGIGGYQSSYVNGRYGRGAPANGGGGGNSHNAGGGGGANGGSSGSWTGFGNPHNLNSNWTTAWNLEGAGFSSTTSSGGGRGGYSWSNGAQNPITTGPGDASWSGDSRYNVGGFGGRPLSYSSGKMYLGGGGGAGDSNNNVGTPGGNGGGIVYLLSGGAVSGTGIINANGESVPASSGSPGDAGGGGGGGGTIIIFTYGASISGLTLSANGGAGGSQSLNNGNEVEGNGGGGGGGYISTTNNTGLTRTVNGGAYGTTNAPPMSAFIANGATSGGPGTITTGPPNPYTTPTPLPVKLSSFSGQVVNNTVKLKWVTSSELNNDYFSIEQSRDGAEFSEIAKVQGAGNSTIEINYSYNDDKPLNGSSYYRLSQTDYDGKRETFNTIMLKLDKTGSVEPFSIVSASPVPFKDKLHIEFQTIESRSVELWLLSAEGKVIRRARMNASSGNNSFDWKDLSDLKPGTYLVYILSNGKSLSARKIVK
ncbi:MAG: T9SS type A sorting domain-containing protein [Bacteroidetes bacterium]|nr:MAG: T9SS type A sorting domain-containing protein [Bacteroidota bacterium]